MPCIEIAGPLDHRSKEADEIARNLLEESENQEKDLIVDLRQSGFMTSEGLAILINILKFLRPGGRRLVLLGPAVDMIEFLKFSGVADLITIVEKEGEICGDSR